MSLMHKVALVGRTNVGKSSLFNRIAPKVKSLAYDQEGVTRDMVTDLVTWNNTTFELIDTGGIDLVKPSDEMTAVVTQRVQQILQEASLFLMVVDVQVGVTQQDKRIARLLHTFEKPTLILINKVDSQHQEDGVHEFYQLGFEELYGVSALHGRTIADVLDRVVQLLSEVKVIHKVIDETPEFRVALLGRPNAGKSSLMNQLLKQDFSIVSPMAGTTREALRKRIAFQKNVIELIDTAGVRKKSSVDEGLEEMMVTNSLQAAKRAHIVLMVMDVQEPDVTAQELKLTSYALENGSAVIVLFNKQDLLTDDTKLLHNMSLEQYEHVLKKLEVLNISCKSGKNIGKVLPLVQEVWDRYQMRLTDRFLSDLFIEALAKAPLFKNQQQLFLYKARQVGNAPMRIELILRNAVIFEKSHQAFFENVLRKAVDLKSVPVLWTAVTRSKRK
ncbi:ribosome biogenesis GTPase Der [Candidatus Babeliales bacterium]|nr:ribosome biogenesis GTPase Der [Candidatus Babeliales bacterium]